MPAVSLSDDPSLEYLRRRCRELQRAVRRGEPEALRRLTDRGIDVPGDPGTFPLSGAQLVVARECGFASWPRLRRYLDVVAEYRWDAREPPGGGYPDVADEFCRQACLTYSDDGPHRWTRARRLLAEHPTLPRDSVWAAATAADPDAVRRHLAADPSLATRRGGPYRWRPLFYLAYSRLDPAVAAEPVLATARLLLSAGADPDEGYLWGGLPTPFTLLTGVFGEGEQGPGRQPRHPHCPDFARLLLAAGANANDGQTLYNRMFLPDDDHLRLLFEFGLGRGDGGVWKRRLGEALDSPAGMLRGQLAWAIDHDFLDRVRLLVRYGVDTRSPFDDGRTPAERARWSGHREIVRFLLTHGAAVPEPDPVDDLIGTALAADRPAVRALCEAHPGLAERARRRRPGLVVWAAASGRGEAVRLLVELGFDVNALARGDTPGMRPWETALHRAVAANDVELARMLLALGADPDIRDARFASTPLGWARHFGFPDLIELLEPVTAEPPIAQPPAAAEAPPTVGAPPDPAGPGTL